jgi:transglutaminase-like putative cysteine protease
MLFHPNSDQRSTTPTTVTLQEIPDGKAGVLATLKIMRKLVLDGKRSLNVRMTALNLVKNLLQKDWGAEIRALHSFVRDEIRYVKDINDLETLHTTDKILEIRQGDCDDKAVLLAAMLESIGHPTRLVAVAMVPGVFVHVYVETFLRNHWMTLESTEPCEAGWRPKNIVDKIIVNI